MCKIKRFWQEYVYKEAPLNGQQQFNRQLTVDVIYEIQVANAMVWICYNTDSCSGCKTIERDCI